MLETQKAFAAVFQSSIHFQTHPERFGTAVHSTFERGITASKMKSLLGQTSGYYRINSMRARMYYCTYLHTRGRAGKKRKQRRGKKLHFALSKGLHCQFYLGKAVAEAAEWGTAAGSGTQGMKEQSLYHPHSNTVVMGRHTNW